jgi:Bacterial Ig-like domain (group 3)
MSWFLLAICAYDVQLDGAFAATLGNERAGVVSALVGVSEGVHTLSVAGDDRGRASVTQPAGGSWVTVYYDPKDGWLTHSGERIPSVPGTFHPTSCQDWAPDCLAMLMRDFDRDGIFELRTRLPTSSAQEFKIALALSWDENYPSGNVLVPAVANDPLALLITYDDTTHVPSFQTYAPEHPQLWMSATVAGQAVEQAPFGAPVQLVFEVRDTPGSAVPPAQGEITFAGARQGSARLDGDARASIDFSAQAMGTYAFAASYPGDVSHEAAEASAHLDVVPAGVTLTAVAPGQVQVDEPFDVRMSGFARAPSVAPFTEVFVLKESDEELVRVAADGQGKALAPLTFATRGVRELVLVNAPTPDVDAHFTSAFFPFSVDVRGFTTAVLPALVDEQVRVQIASEGLATGAVKLIEGNQVVATQMLSDNRVTFTLTLTPGKHTLFAIYDGDLRHEPATSTGFTLDVDGKGTPTKITEAEKNPKSGCRATGADDHFGWIVIGVVLLQHARLTSAGRRGESTAHRSARLAR